MFSTSNKSSNNVKKFRVKSNFIHNSCFGSQISTKHLNHQRTKTSICESKNLFTETLKINNDTTNTIKSTFRPQNIDKSPTYRHLDIDKSRNNLNFSPVKQFTNFTLESKENLETTDFKDNIYNNNNDDNDKNNKQSSFVKDYFKNPNYKNSNYEKKNYSCIDTTQNIENSGIDK